MTQLLLDDEVISSYTRGDCWVLAKEFLKQGLPVVTCSALKDKMVWIHAANRLPSGEIIDAEGIWEETEWVERWESTLLPEEKIKMGAFTVSNWTAEEFHRETFSQFADKPMYGISAQAADHANLILKANRI